MDTSFPPKAHRESEAYRCSQKSASKEQIQEVPKKTEGYTGIHARKIKVLNSIEKHHWCSIIYNTFSKYKTVKEGCLILM